MHYRVNINSLRPQMDYGFLITDDFECDNNKNVISIFVCTCTWQYINIQKSFALCWLVMINRALIQCKCINDLVQDCGNSSALAMELLQSCTKPLISSFQYRKSHCENKMVMRLSYFHNGISNAGKMILLFWISPLALTFCEIGFQLPVPF